MIYRRVFALVVLVSGGWSCSSDSGVQSSGAAGNGAASRARSGGRRAGRRDRLRESAAPRRRHRRRGDWWRCRGWRGRTRRRSRHRRRAVADRAAALRCDRRRAHDPARVRHRGRDQDGDEREPERRDPRHRGDSGRDHRLPGRASRAPGDRRRQDRVRIGWPVAEGGRQPVARHGDDAVRVAQSTRVRRRCRQVRRKRYGQLGVQTPDQRRRPDGLRRRRRAAPSTAVVARC